MKNIQIPLSLPPQIPLDVHMEILKSYDCGNLQ